MIERQIEAPVLPGDDDGPLSFVSEAMPAETVRGVEDVYIEPGGLVDIAVNELGGEVTSVEYVPDKER